MMFEPHSELASDLDWMLQSGQASSERLAAAMLKEQFAPIFCLAAALLGGAHQAYSAVLEILSTALSQTYTYRSELGVQVWLYSIALQVIQRRLRGNRRLFKSNDRSPLPAGSEASGKYDGFTWQAAEPCDQQEALLWQVVDRLPWRLRLPLILDSLFHWPTPELAKVMGEAEDAIAQRLGLARLRVWVASHRSAADSTEAAQEERAAWQRQSLQRRWPPPELSDQDFETAWREILRQSSTKNLSQRRVSGVKEFLLVAAAILAVAGILWGANRLFPDAGIEEALMPGRARTRTIAAAEQKLAETRAAQSTEVANPYAAMTPMPTLPPETFYRVRAGDTIESVARRLNTSPQELRRINRIARGATLYPDQILVNPGRLPELNDPTPTPAHPPTYPPPLEADATSQEILDRLRGGLFNPDRNFWFDAQFSWYGPPNYFGPGATQRIQVWFGDRTLLISGPGAKDPTEIVMSPDNVYLAQTGENWPWLHIPRSEADVTQLALITVFESVLRFSFSGPNQVSSYHITGSGTISGRDAWLIEERDSSEAILSKIWLDKLTSVPMRWQRLALDGSGAVISEYRLNALAYSFSAPNDLFDPRLPWRGGYASGPDGAPEPLDSPLRTPPAMAVRQPLPYIPAPDGFDPSKGQINFQFGGQDPPYNLGLEPELQPFRSQSGPIPADLFAGGFYLGQVQFANPLWLACRRSPDGAKIAFMDNADTSLMGMSAQSSLRWFDLRHLPEVHELLPTPNSATLDFNFAPDSQRLAVLVFNWERSGRELYIVDMGTGEQNLLATTSNDAAYSLDWSPDGGSLALLGVDYSPSGEAYVVVQIIDAATGEIQSDYSYARGSATATPEPGTPAAGWRPDFPPPMGGLETCGMPPKD